MEITGFSPLLQPQGLNSFPRGPTEDLDATHYSAPGPDHWLSSELLLLSWAISATQLPDVLPGLPASTRAISSASKVFRRIDLVNYDPCEKKNTFYARLFLAHTRNHPCLHATFISSVFDSCFGIIICLQYSFPHKKTNFVQSQISFLSLDFIWLAQGPMHAKIRIVIIHMIKWLSLWVPTWMKSCLNEFGVCFTSGQWYKVITKWTPLLFSFSQEDNFFFWTFSFPNRKRKWSECQECSMHGKYNNYIIHLSKWCLK